jgi:hypothetical protein
LRVVTHGCAQLRLLHFLTILCSLLRTDCVLDLRCKHRQSIKRASGINNKSHTYLIILICMIQQKRHFQQSFKAWDDIFGDLTESALSKALGYQS